MVPLLNVRKVDVISNPHVLQRLKEKPLFKLPLSENTNEYLLSEIECKQSYQKSTALCFGSRAASNLNEFEPFLQIDCLVAIVDYLVEVFHLRVCSSFRSAVGICEMKDSHQIVQKQLLTQIKS